MKEVWVGLGWKGGGVKDKHVHVIKADKMGGKNPKIHLPYLYC